MNIKGERVIMDNKKVAIIGAGYTGLSLAKKLVEIRNRGVKRPDDIKRFKN